MSDYLHIDFETRSEIELGGTKSVGVHNYSLHSSTQILMMAWAFGDEEVELWEPRKDELPQKLLTGLNNPKQLLAAYNSQFERNIFNHCWPRWFPQYKLSMPIERFQDPQASARYLSLPGYLDEVGTILGLPYELQKDKRGEELLDLFAKPSLTRKKKGEERKIFFATPESNPEAWRAFGEYCKKDVVAEREVMRRLQMLKVFPLPERERKVWIFDQRVNDRGIAVDLNFVAKAYELATREKKEKIAENNVLTGLANSNSNDQMLGWVTSQGYKTGSLRKEAVQAELDFNTELTALCREVLAVRKSASSTTYTKLSAIMRQVSPDGRLRNQFLYMGSSRCGRWSGNAVQLHNMARPTQTFEDLSNVNKLREFVNQNDYDGIKKEFGSVLLAIKSCIRTSFIAERKGQTDTMLRVCDLNAIETRVAAWICECKDLLQVFHDGKDPYLDFAVKMTGIPYEKLEADLKSKIQEIKAIAKGHRQIAKPGVLGCVYRLSGGQIGKHPKTGDLIKKGLWGYAANMGIDQPKEKWHEVVRIFRESYIEIPNFWKIAEDAVFDVLTGGPRTKRQLGPNGCVEIDKIELKDRHPLMRIKLPSGRYLHYMDARIEPTKMPWTNDNGEEVWKKGLIYAGVDQVTKQWRTVTSHGGKILENIVQAIARDILAESLMRFEFGLDMPCVAHVHDEGIVENENDCFSSGVELMEKIMGEPISWAPGLPLKAEGFESLYYHK